MQLPQTVTLEQAQALIERIDAAVAAAAGGNLRIDAAALQQFDTSAVAVLLHAQRLAKAGKVSLSVCGAPPKLRELAALYGVGELLSLEPS